MTFKRPLLTSPIMKTQTELDTNSLCKVCGDKARINNYGALSCSSCKVFFRRLGFHSKNIRRCERHGNCEITILSRRTCTACRFAKCLAVGMNPDQIRKEDLSRNRYKQKQFIIAQSFSSTQPPTLNLLSADQSSLTTSDWKSVSNVVHAFDNFIPIIQTRQTIEYLSNWSSSIPLDISQILSMFTTFYTSTESFIGSSADFQVLTVAEKSSLYQRNLHGVLHLCATFIYRLCGMFDSSANDKIITSVYGYDIFQQTKRIASQIDYDVTIIKLMLFILAFSSNCYTVDEHENMHDDSLLYGTFRLFGSQNVYVEALWKYMIYRYGYYDASLRFARLIKNMLDLLKISENAQQNNEVHKDYVDEITVLTEQSLIINENEFVPLWGNA